IIKTSCLPIFDSWPVRGKGFGPNDTTTPTCDGTSFVLDNGFVFTPTVLFYAPMALGPGSPNTVYFGADRLYRSFDRGDTMTTVSQAPIFQISAGPPPVNSPISTIGIWPGSDNVRIVGLQNGQVWST